MKVLVIGCVGSPLLGDVISKALKDKEVVTVDSLSTEKEFTKEFIDHFSRIREVDIAEHPYIHTSFDPNFKHKGKRRRARKY